MGFQINRAIIQKGETRMMVYYWFDQKGRKIAWDMAAKYWLMIDGIRYDEAKASLMMTSALVPLVYFLFFFFAPVLTNLNQSKPVPERVTA